MIFQYTCNVTNSDSDLYDPQYATVKFDLEKIERIRMLAQEVDRLKVNEISLYDDLPDFYNKMDDDDDNYDMNGVVEYYEGSDLIESDISVISMKMCVFDDSVNWFGCPRHYDNVTVSLESISINDKIKNMERVLKLVESGGSDSVETIISDITGYNREGGDQYIMIKFPKLSQEDTTIRGISGNDREEELNALRKVYDDTVKFFYLDIFNDDSITIKEAPNEKISDPD